MLPTENTYSNTIKYSSTWKHCNQQNEAKLCRYAWSLQFFTWRYALSKENWTWISTGHAGQTIQTEDFVCRVRYMGFSKLTARRERGFTYRSLSVTNILDFLHSYAVYVRYIRVNAKNVRVLAYQIRHLTHKTHSYTHKSLHRHAPSTPTNLFLAIAPS